MTDLVEDPTVLVVDDDRNLADTYAIWLEQEDYGVVTTYGGDEALHRLGHDVDVVLLDRRMATVPGDEVLGEIRRRGGSHRVAMLTAVAPDVDVVELPFDEYLVKPVTKKEVLDAVDELLARDALDEDLADYFALCSKLDALESKEATHVDDARETLRQRVERRRREIEDRVGGHTSAASLVDADLGL